MFIGLLYMCYLILLPILIYILFLKTMKNRQNSQQFKYILICIPVVLLLLDSSITIIKGESLNVLLISLIYTVIPIIIILVSHKLMTSHHKTKQG